MWGWCFDNPCCAGPNTLWKINPSDGSIVWKRDRGADSDVLDVVTIGSDVVIYEGGDRNTSDNGMVDRLTDNGSPTLNWTASAFGGVGTTDVRYSAGSGTVWSIGSWDSDEAVVLDDADGSELDSGLPTGTLHGLFDAPGGDMNIAIGDASLLGPFRQYSDPSTVDVAISVYGLPVPIAGDPVGTGFLTTRRGTLGASDTVRLVDTVLADSDTVDLDQDPIPVQCSENVAWVWGDADGNMYSIDATNLATTNWSSAFTYPAATIGSEQTEFHASYDVSDNLYIFEDISSTINAVRMASSDGSRDWTNSGVTVTSVISTAVASSHFIVAGKGDTGGSAFQVWAYNLSDGDLAWTTRLGDGAAHRMILHGGSLYVCGDRM